MDADAHDSLDKVPFLGEIRAMYEGQTRPRAVALCLFRRDDQLLVQEFWLPDNQITYYRPVGGTIEYGEQSRDAARREVQEELGAEVTNLRHLATLENIFTFGGQIAHEIVFIYEATFADALLYERPYLELLEANGDRYKVVWKPLSDFHPDRSPLFPTALYQLLMEQ